MALSSATLASELDAQVGNVATEAAARTAWAQAWNNYFGHASCGGTISGLALPAAKSAMASALTGMSSSGASAIQAGIAAWWAALVPATAFAGATVITPPATVSGIAAALASVFTTNNAPGVTKTQALANLAAVLHANGGLGGTATIAGTPTAIL